MFNFNLEQLNTRKQQGLYRYKKIIDGAQGVTLQHNNRNLLNFASNDYLNLANHPNLIKAVQDAIVHSGVGSGSSHLICGHHNYHHQLEKDLAQWLQRPAVLLFSSGYMANLGVLTSLVKRGDIILQDKLSHASLIDGAKLSGASLKRFRHNDVLHLKKLLQDITPSVVAPQQVFIVTEGIFSMDGDVAPLADLVDLAQKYNACLIVDDAHGFGVCGEDGRGTTGSFSSEEIPVVIGTLSKTFGSYGAFVAGSLNLVDSLTQFARSYIYTTALPPCLAAASSASLTLVKQATAQRLHLHNLISYFSVQAKKLHLDNLHSASHIQPIIWSNLNDVMAVSEYLVNHNILVVPIRYPTVPINTDRLRITLTAAHTHQDVDKLFHYLDLWLQQSSS